MMAANDVVPGILLGWQLVQDNTNALAPEWLAVVGILSLSTAVFIYLYFMGQLQLRRKMEEKDQQIGEYKAKLFKNISHEIRSPLTLIKGPIGGITSNTHLRPEDRIALEQIDKNANRLISISAQIARVANYEQSDPPIEQIDCYISESLRSVFQSFVSEAKEKGVSYDFENNIDNQLLIKTDINRLNTVLHTLIKNAIRYTPDSGTVLMSASMEQEQLKVEVKDSGDGIRKEDLFRIFKTYSRTKNPGKKEDAGFGLGLPLAQKLIRKLGGDLEVESEWQKGTTFSIQIPVETLTAPQVMKLTERDFDEGLTDPEEDIPGKKKKVMVIEDLPDMRSYIESILSRKYEVITAENGMDGLAQLEAMVEPVELIISDLMMPKMDGFEVLKYVRNHDTFKNIPFLILTARTADEVQLEAFTIGVDDYLTKPFNTDVLLAHCHHLIVNGMRRSSDEQELSKEDAEAMASGVGVADKEWLDRVKKLIMDNIDNPNFNLYILSDEMAVGERQLRRKMKSLTGFSPVEYIRETKLNHARRLLETGTYRSVSEVAHEVGFNDSSYFSKMYRKRFGHAPMESKI